MDQNNKNHNLMLEKTNGANIGDSPVSLFMNTHCVKIKPNYTVKSTIETFRIHHLSGAPIVDYQDKIIGVISEYDLLIQAASKQLNDHIDYQTQIISVTPETTLKEVLVILYKKKLKWMPVVNKENFMKGVISRIDVLNFIASQSPNA